MSAFRPPTLPAIPVLGIAALLVAACGGGGASYPDSSDVKTAQATWCQALAKLNGSGDAWEDLGACKGAYPTASAAYLRGMTRCFTARHEAAGEDAPDNSQLITECNDEVTVEMSADGPGSKEVIEARCQRAERCEKVSAADCKTAVDKLETAQRVVLTTTYNAGALHAIADCLSSSSCSDDEEAARDSCYKPSFEKLLWFPD